MEEALPKVSKTCNPRKRFTKNIFIQWFSHDYESHILPLKKIFKIVDKQEAR